MPTPSLASPAMPDPGRPPEEQRVPPLDRKALPRDRSARSDAGSLPSPKPEQVATPALSYPGSELIGSGGPHEVLARIVVGDPLGIVARARVWLDANAYLVDSNRLGLRTMAHVAHSAKRYRGKPDLHAWIELLLERSVRELIEEDREGERKNRPIEVDEVAPYGFLCDALGLEAQTARRACVIFNGMAEYDRRVFYATSVMGKSLHRHVSEGFGPPARAEAALQRVLRRLSSLPGLPGGGP